MQFDPNWNDASTEVQAQALIQLGISAAREGNFQAAANYFIVSLELGRALGDLHLIVKVLIYLSFLAVPADFGDGLDVKARKRALAAEALPLAREVGDSGLLAEALITFANDVSEGSVIALLREGVALAEKGKDKATLARGLAHLSKLLSDPRDEKRARKLQIRALGLYEEIGDEGGVADVLFSMAIWADNPQKRIYLKRVIELRRRRHDNMRIVECLLMLESSFDRTDLKRREPCIVEALSLCRESNESMWAAGCLHRLAQIARSRGDITHAEQLDADSRDIYVPQYDDISPESAMVEALAFGDHDDMIEAARRVRKG